MRYFNYIADQAFKTAPDGRRLFYRGGPWSRPYVVPDDETEQRLFTKQLWMMRVLLGGMIIGQPFLFVVVPNVIGKPLWFLSYMAIVLAIFWVAGRVVFHGELTQLSRTDARIPLHDFYSAVSAQHSTGKLLLLLVGASGFVAAGLWMLSTGHNPFVAWLSIGFFGLCTIAGVYAFVLKVTGW